MIDPQILAEYHAAINDFDAPRFFWSTRGELKRLLRVANAQHKVLDALISDNLGLNKPTARAMAPRDVGGDPIDLTEEMARHAQLRELICPHPECSYNEGEGDRTLCGDTQCPYRPENFARQHAAE